MAGSTSFREDVDVGVTNTQFTLTELRASSSGPNHEGLRIAHLNVCGLRGKLDKIQSLLKNHQFDILAITEAKLTPKKNMRLSVDELNEMVVSDNVIQIEGYRFERLDRDVRKQTGQGGGGIVVYVREGVDYSQPVTKFTESDHDAAPLQYIHIEVTRPVPVNVFAVYLPPQYVVHAKAARDNLLNNIFNEGLANVVFLGDFNIDLGRWRDRSFGGNVFTQLIENYTRMQKGKHAKRCGTRIDHIYTNNHTMILESGVVRRRISDHALIYCTVNKPSPASQLQPQPSPDELLSDDLSRMKIGARRDGSDCLNDNDQTGHMSLQLLHSQSKNIPSSPTPSVRSAGTGNGSKRRWTPEEDEKVMTFAKKTGGRTIRVEVERFIKETHIDRTADAVIQRIHNKYKK